MARTPTAPRHLTKATRQWWNVVVREYQLEAHHLRILQSACESWDRYQQAREALDENGLTIVTQHGVRARPEVAIERDSRLAFAKLVGILDLDVEPPQTQQKRGRKSAASLMTRFAGVPDA